MKFQGAQIKEQGVNFAVVIVKPSLLQNSTERENTRNTFAQYFQTPVVLMSQDSRGTPTYHGKPDIARFLASIDISRIPWRNFSIN